MSEERHRAVEVASREYDVEEVLLQLATVPAGTNLLVSGPAMVGKTELAAELTSVGVERGEHAVVVTADEGARQIRSQFPETDRLHVVDCTGSGGSFDDTEVDKFVSSPGDLTGIGIGITKCTQSIGEGASDGVRLAVLSLSTILRYTSLDALFNFVHVLTGRIASTGYLGVFTVDPTLHDDRTLNTIRAQMDGLVELREAEDGGRQARVTGLPDASGEWTTL